MPIKIAVFCFGLLSACTDDAVFDSEGNIEKKPIAALIEGRDAAAITKPPPEARLAAEVTYDLRIKTPSGAALCNGEVSVRILTNFNIEFPSGFTNCLSLRVDLARMLGSQGSALGGGGLGGLGTTTDVESTSSTIQHDGTVLYLSQLAGAEFSPPRPFLVGPIIQNPRKYRDLRKTVRTTVRGSDASGAFSGSGAITIEVLDEQGRYGNELLRDSFENVMHWQIRTSGFEGIKRKNGLLFERWEWLWNVRPIMIPKIIIVGDVGDFITPAEGADPDLASKAVGKLKVTLTAIHYTPGDE